MGDTLYQSPLYYDIAFSWDLDREIDFFGRVFGTHVPFPVKRMLEPACGTGRFLVALPHRGYRVTGYDVSPAMLEFARKRVAEAGIPEMVEFVEAHMATARFDRVYDAALNSINSLGYLRADEDIVSHFRNTGLALKPGGVYIVHMACAGNGCSGGSTWEMERGDVRVTTTWSLDHDDAEAMISHQICTMAIEAHGHKKVLVDRHDMRLWFYRDFQDLVARSGALRLEAVYSERFESVPLETDVTGEMGNLYYILKSV